MMGDEERGGDEENKRRIRELLTITLQQIHEARRAGYGSYETLSALQDVRTPARNKDDMPVYIWKEKEEKEGKNEEATCVFCLLLVVI